MHGLSRMLMTSESPSSIPDPIGEKTSQPIWTIIPEEFFLKVLRYVELELHDDFYPLNNVLSPPRCQKPPKFGILVIISVVFRGWCISKVDVPDQVPLTFIVIPVGSSFTMH